MGYTQDKLSEHRRDNNLYYQRNKQKCLERARKYRKRNRQEINQKRRQSKVKERWEVLSHYSNGVPKCACCGIRNYEFLSIDHINNDGAKHRKKVPSSQLYQWLRLNKYPEGFQVLCFNCNLAKGFYGMCPHKKPVVIWRERN